MLIEGHGYFYIYITTVINKKPWYYQKTLKTPLVTLRTLWVTLRFALRVFKKPSETQRRHWDYWGSQITLRSTLRKPWESLKSALSLPRKPWVTLMMYINEKKKPLHMTKECHIFSDNHEICHEHLQYES